MTIICSSGLVSLSQRRRSGYVMELPGMVDNATLIARVRQRDQAAARLLYERYVGHVQTLLVRVLGTDPDIQDLTQQTFAEVLSNIAKLKDIDRLKAWIGSISVNVARTAIRKRQRRRMWIDSADDIEIASAGSGMRVDTVLHQHLYSVLARLDVDDRIALTLRWIDGRTISEVAELCEISVSTVKRRLERGRRDFLVKCRIYPDLASRIGGDRDDE